MGTILAAVFASASIVVFSGPRYHEGMTMGSQLQLPAIGVVSCLVSTALASYVLLKLVDNVLGLRVSQDEETEGLDLNQHNERGYDL